MYLQTQEKRTRRHGTHRNVSTHLSGKKEMWLEMMAQVKTEPMLSEFRGSRDGGAFTNAHSFRKHHTVILSY